MVDLALSPGTDTSLTLAFESVPQIAPEHGTWSIDDCVVLDEVTGAQTPLTPTVPAPCTIFIRGWAIDPRGGGLAAGVLALINGRAVEVFYGDYRRDVAEAKRDPRVTRCGFSARFRFRQGSGAARIELFAVSGEVSAAARLGEAISINLRSVRLDQAIATPRREGAANVYLDGWSANAAPEHPMDEPLKVERGALVTLRGWSVDASTGRSPYALYALLDAAVPVRALVGLPRPDVATALDNAALAQSGFIVRLDTATLDIGSHTVRFLVVGEQSEYYDFGGVDLTLDVLPRRALPEYATGARVRAIPVPGSRAYEITDQLRGPTAGLALRIVPPRRPNVAVVRLDSWQIDDCPAEPWSKALRVPIGAVVTISGWAADQSAMAAPAATYALIDGALVSAAISRLPRRDIAAAYANPRYETSGFMYRLDSLTLPIGAHVLRFAILTEDGAAYDIADTVLRFEVVHAI